MFAIPFLLSSCARQAVLPPASETPAATRPAPPAKVPPQVQRPAANLDEYKTQVAQQINSANPHAIFSGRLPPMMAAIVVLDIGIGRDGDVVALRVHRTPDEESARIALAAVKQAAPYPKPAHLLKGGHHTLAFSETFLFNRDYRFQLRTLSGPQ
jgi:protein TonB